MSEDEDKLDKIDRKLDGIRRDVNDIQGDVRLQAKLHKDLNKPQVMNQTFESFGQSTAKKKIWYYANGERTSSEIAEKADIAPATASRNASDLVESGVLDRFRDGNNVYFDRAEMTIGIGIEQELEEDLDL